MSEPMPSDEGKKTCEAVTERLEAYHYRDLEPDELGTIEAHLEACSRCRAALEATRETAAGLDRLEVRSPGELEWARFDARLEARLAPLRAERLARRAAAGGGGRRARWFAPLRIAAAVLILGLGGLSGKLWFKVAELEREAERGRIPGTLLVTEIDHRPLHAYNLARAETGERQREQLLDFLATFPRHWLADEVFATLQRRGDVTPRSLDVASARRVHVVAQPLPGKSAAEHYAREVERLRALARPEQDPRFNAYALLRAARVAEKELGNPERAVEEYRQVLATVPAGPVRDFADERIRALELRR